VSTRIKNTSLATLLLGAIAVPVSHATAATCESLSNLSLSEVLSIEAKSFAGGTFQPPNPSGFVPTAAHPFAFSPISGLPAFCEVSIVVAPQINIEIWLPLAGAWNHRFEGVGGGGYAGTISWSSLAAALEGGFATASTDTGHSAFAPNNGASGGGFALNQSGDTLNWGLIEDFAQRSEHQLAVKAKAAIHAFFDETPRFSYWKGCSTGGRQGWIEAQRHPDDYDGILAGAPAMNWDRFIPAELWPQIVMNEEAGSPIAASKLNAATSAAIAACVGKDGGLATDAFLSDPRLCQFDPTVNPAALSLTSAEAGAIKKIWDGPRNSRDERVWFGLEPGTPLGGLAGGFPFPIATDHFVYWIHQDATFDWHTVTESSFFTDFNTSEVLYEDVVGTDRSNLNGFIRHGTKLIGYHGWADVLIFPEGSVNYFHRLWEHYGRKKVDEFARLFMVPGMGHCGGGTGPNAFGNGLPVPADAQHDAFIALQQWVENGVAPEQLIATKYVNDNPASGVAFTRPLCKFPKVAHYLGAGVSTDAANWSCVDGADSSAIEEADQVLPDHGASGNGDGDN
jgi:Tannase and feruloyl esterase